MRQAIYSIAVSISIIALATLSLSSAQALTERDRITAENISQLTQIHTLPGTCAEFNSDETLIATTNGLFDLSNGDVRIDLSGSPVERPEQIGSSPTERWIIMNDRIFSVATGELTFTLPYTQVRMVFSSNDDLVHIHGITYETATWQSVDPETIPDFEPFGRQSGGKRYVWRDITSGNGLLTYVSHNGTYWVHPTDGIFEVSTGEQVTVPDEVNDPAMLESSIFSPDDAMFFTGGDGIDIYRAYKTPDFTYAYDLPFDVGHWRRYYVTFSPDSAYFGMADDGIYQTDTGERLFEIIGNPVFSPDNLLVGAGDGLYEVSTGKQIQAFSEGARVLDFSGDNTLVAVWPDGVFETTTGEKRFDFDIESMVGFGNFGMDSSLLYVTTNHPALLIYDTATGTLQQELTGAQPILSANERYLALQIPDAQCAVYAIGE